MTHYVHPTISPEECSGYFGKKLIDLLIISEGSIVLDIGVGGGASLIPAAKAVGPQGEVVGIDISKDAVQLTCRRIEEFGLKNAKALVMNGLQMTFECGIFDFVIGGFVLSDLHRQDKRLAEIHRVLKDDGRVGFYSWKYAEDAELMAGFLKEHEGLDVHGADSVIFDQETEESMYSMLSDAAFKDIEVLIENVDITFKDEEEWWQEMQDIGWRHHLKEIEAKGKDKLKRFKEYSFEVLQDYWDGDSLRFIESVFFGFGTK